ncbi:MAG: T9SS type A sorting domain-containing protein, partial [Bacteroidales bacterium]|nr:T9SS type A sorting domain-containing protein [Bacteroidales bacterium]
IANAGVDATICEDASYDLTTATVINASGQFWTGGDGSFTNSDENSLNPTYTPAGQDFVDGYVDLCLVAEPVTPCEVNSAEDCMTLTIQKLPTVFAGDDATSCALAPYPLVNAEAFNYLDGSVKWTTSGDGSFDNDEDLNTTYNPGTTDFGNSSVTLTVQVSPIAPCNGAPVSDEIVIFIQQEVAVIFANEDGQFYQNANLEYCFDETITITLDEIVTGVAPFNFAWDILEGGNTVDSGFADGVNLDDTLFSETYAPGSYTVQLTSMEDVNGCSPSNISIYTMNLVVNPEPTMEITLDAAAPQAINEYCYDDSFEICLTGVDGTADWTVEWAVTGPSGSFADVMTGTSECFPFNAADFLPGTYDLTVVSLTDAKNCAASQATLDSYAFQIVINPEPTLEVTLDGFTPDASNEYCYDDSFEICLTGVDGTTDWTVEWAVTGSSGPFADVMTGTSECFPFNAADFLPGTYDLTIVSLTDAKNCAASQATLDSYAFQIVINPEPTLEVTLDGIAPAASNEYCYDDSFEICLTGVDGTADWTVEWAVTGPSGPFADVMTGTSECFPFNAADFLPGTYDLTIVSLTDAKNCSASQATLDSYAFQIVINPEPTLEVTLDAAAPQAVNEYCYDDSFEICLTGVDGTPDWTVEWAVTGPSGPFADVMTGTSECFPFNAADFLPGTYDLTIVSLTDAKNCAASQATLDSYAFQIVINPEPTLEVTLDAVAPQAVNEYCFDDSFEICLTGVDGTPDWTVEWAVTGPGGPFADVMTGTSECFPFNAADFLPGTYDLTVVSLTDANNCPASQATLDSYAFQIVIHPQPNPYFTISGDPLEVAGSYEYCFDVTDIPLALVETQGGNTTVGAEPFAISFTVNSGTPIDMTNVYFDDFVDLLAYTSGPGFYEIQVTSIVDGNGCAIPQTVLNNYYYFDVTINPEPAIIFANNGIQFYEGATLTYCEGENIIITLDEIVSGEAPFDITWELNGVEASALDVEEGNELFNGPLAADNYSIVITSIVDANGCSPSDLAPYHATVVVGPPPAIIFAANGNQFYEGAELKYCEDDNITLTLDEVVLGQAPFAISWTVNGDLFSDDEVFVDDELFNGTKPVGVYELVITSIVDANGCSPLDYSAYNATIEVVGKATVYAGEDATICEGENFPLDLATAEYYSSLLWSSNGTGEFDPNPAIDIVQPTYIPGAGDVGNTVTLLLVAQPLSPCTAIANDLVTLFVQPAVTAYAGEDATICEGAMFPLDVAAVTNASSFEWTTTGNGSFDNPNDQNPTYDPTLDLGTTVTLCLTAQPVNPCDVEAESCLDLLLQPNPTVYAGENITICEGDVLPMSDATAENYSTLLWSHNGQGEFNDPALVNPTYIPGNGEVGNLTLFLVAQPKSPCQNIASDFVVLYIQPAPYAYAGEDATLCDGENLALSNATADDVMSALWTTSGDGTFANPIAIHGNTYYPAPADLGNTVTLCLTVQPANPCDTEAQDCFTLLVQPQATAFAGNDATIMSSETYELTEATASNYSSLLWETSGNGTFTPGNDVLQPTYTPGLQDIVAGEVLLTLTANGLGTCDIAQHNFVLTVLGIPPTVDIVTPVDGTFFNYSPVLVEGTAADEDGSIDFVEVRVNGGAWQLATGTDVWSIEVQLDPCLNVIEARSTDTQSLQSDIDQVANIQLNGQKLELKEGWSYISSYIETADPDFYTLEDYIVPANNVVIMFNDAGTIFWPSEEINNLGSWNNQDGYKVKSNADGTWLLAGDNTANQTITLSSGPNIFPVLTNVNYPLPGDFNNADILIIFELPSAKIYWPAGGLYTLTELKPGIGYLGNFYNSFDITYPAYVDCDLKSDGSSVEYVTNESPWQLERTASVHLISISGESVAALNSPEFIGAFDNNGMCIGYADVREKADNYLMVIYGDEISTGSIDGAIAGEAINLIAYNGVEEPIVANYDPSMPNFDGKYALNGLSKITSFKESSTGVGNVAEVSELIRVFPNPASGMVNIYYPVTDGNNSTVSVTFTNTSGSVVMQEMMSGNKAEIDISNLQPGVYFVKFENKGSVDVKRLVIK